MKSKFFALLLALAVPLSLSACGGDTATEETPPETTEEAPVEGEEGATDDSSAPTADETSDATTEAGEGDWVTYSPSSGLYEVKFPGEPTEQSQTVPVQDQEIELSLALYEDNSAGRAYMSGANPIPLPEGATFDVERGLDGGRDNAAASTNSTVESEEKITVSGLPARSIVMATPQGVRFKLMMVADVDNAVLYQLLVGAEDGNIEFEEADRFFDSFAVTQS